MTQQCDSSNMGMGWSVVNFMKEFVLKVVLQTTAAIIKECTKYPLPSLHLFGFILRASKDKDSLPIWSFYSVLTQVSIATPLSG